MTATLPVLLEGGGGGDLTGLAGWAQDIMTSLGGPGVGALIALENLFPPIPSEVILPLGGFLAGQGRLALAEVIIWATVGSVVGALALYLLGKWFGLERMRWVADKVPIFSVDDVDKADRWFDRYGSWAVLLGRCIPVVRSFISIPAGVSGMPIWKFLLFTTIGSAVWNSVFIVLGFVLGNRFESIGEYSDPINYAVVAIIVGIVGWFVIRRLRARRRARNA